MTSESLLEFLTSKTGLFAAVLAVLALVAAVVQLARPALERRRARADVRPDLRIANLRVTPPPPWSEAAQVEFELVNSGKGKAVLTDLLLAVVEHGAAELPKLSIEAAPLPQYSYRVTLRPDVVQYDVRKKEFGKSPPHSYSESEAEAIAVELRSTEPHWYRFELVLRWYDAKATETRHELRSEARRIEFPPSIEQALLRSSN